MKLSGEILNDFLAFTKSASAQLQPAITTPIVNAAVAPRPSIAGTTPVRPIVSGGATPKPGTNTSQPLKL